jgi:FKBP-type peptidyl-prolyl cis-trans isomerase FklB
LMIGARSADSHADVPLQARYAGCIARPRSVASRESHTDTKVNSMRALFLISLLLSATPLFAQSSSPPARPDSGGFALRTQLDSVSYAVGLNLGQQALRDSIDLNSEAVAQGIHDARDSMRALLNSAEMQMVMMRFQQELMVRQEERMMQEMKDDSVAGIANKAAERKFLAENRTKPGVKTLPSGVQYRVIKEGSGPNPRASDEVVVHYTGRLLNGKIFDSSVERGQPATFTLNSVIEGWAVTLQKMKVGSKWEVFIPSRLAYGSQKMGDIPGNSTLIFEIELIRVNGRR